MSALLFGLALTVGAPALKDKSGSTDLVGDWVVESFTFNGASAPTGTHVRLTADGRAVFEGPGAGPTFEGTYTAERSKSPAEIDIRFTDTKAMSMIGIFKAERGGLVVCFGPTARPTEFESPAGSLVGLLVLKPARKKD